MEDMIKYLNDYVKKHYQRLRYYAGDNFDWIEWIDSHWINIVGIDDQEEYKDEHKEGGVIRNAD